jgi:hypothetical protein
VSGDDDELIEFRVSAAAIAKNGQLDAFREIFGRKFLGLDIEPLDGHPLQFEALLRVLPNFAVASGPRSPMRARHTAELINNDDLLIVVTERGAGELTQHGRAASIRDGEAVLVANGAPATFAIPTPTRTITYRCSRALLATHLPHLDDLVARPIDRNSPALKLLVGYAGVLNDQRALGTAELRRSVTTHMHELAALLLGATPGPQLAPGFRAARLKAVKDDILRRITRGGVSVAEVARSQQISPRYMRQLFAAAGTTFTDFVREAAAGARAWLADRSGRAASAHPQGGL